MANEPILPAYAGFTRTARVILMSIMLGSLTAGHIFGDSPEKPTSAKPARAALLSVPLSFEANQGQTDPAVNFLSRGDGYALFLTADSAVFKLSSSSVVRMKLAGANPHASVSGSDTLPGIVNYFLGNDPNKWISGVSTFGRANYREIYRGIDLVYYGTQRQLEYDFIVAPGADPRQIGLEFAGASPMLGPDGSLVLTLDGAPLTFRKPVAWQTIAGRKQMIAGNYKLSGGHVQFALGKYDHNRALVIDPVVTYLTYLGGSKDDIAGNTTYSPGTGNTTQGMVADQAGNVYLTGYTQSTNFPLQGPIQKVNNTNAPTGFVAKLNPAGTQLLYSTYIGGGVLNDNTITQPYAIAVDGSGNAYLTGFTSAPQFPVTAGAYQPVCGTLVNNVTNCPATQSAFLTKLSPAGGLVYSTFLGHSGETGVAVAVDAKGQAYVAGNSGAQCASNGPNNCFPTTPNAVLPGSAFNHTTNPSNFNQGSAFISVLDAAGANLLYSSLLGGDGSPAGNEHPTFGSDVAVDSSGYFYLAVTTQSNQLPVTPGAFQTTYYGNPNPGFGTSSRGFVAKFNPVSSGAALVYGTYLGGFDKTVGSYQDVISGIAADAAGNAYISGNASYDFPATAGANNSTPCPSANSCENRGFLAKLNPAGSGLVWATFVGTVTNPTLSSADTISPPRLDAAGNIYVSGIAGNNTEYPLVNPLQPANGFASVYVTMYDPTGSTIYFSTVIYDPTGNNQIFSSGVDADSQGNIYVAGYTAATGLPVTAGAFQTANAGGHDAFIDKINIPAPTVTTGGVVPVFSTVSTVQPGEWTSIYGANLAIGTTTWIPGSFPTSLGGTSVTIDGKSAFLWYVSPTQINLQVPADSNTGSVPVVVKTAAGAVVTSTVILAPFAPSFSLLDSKHVAGIILRSNGSGAYGGGTYDIIGPTGSPLGYATVAAKAGDTVELFGVGFGPTNPPVPVGAIFSGAAATTNPVTLSINNVSVAPFFAGESSAGLYQLNVTIPPGLGTGDVPLQGFVGGSQTPAVVISLQ
jgi:uncharacterized protein (TIGR03437 family)